MKRFLFLLLALTVLSPFVRAAGPEPLPLAPEYNLRVYGALKVKDSTPPGAYYQRIQVTTQSSAKAKILVSKFLRDFTVTPNVLLQSTKTGESSSLPAIAFEDGRRILPVLKPGESTVDFYLFARQMDLTRFLSASDAAEGALAIEGRQYPYFFDFWDRHCMGSWYSGRIDWGRDHYTEPGNVSYMKKLGLNMNLGGSYMIGVPEADRYGIGYKFNRWLDVSPSSYDSAPEGATRGDPDVTFLASYYGDVPYADNPVGFGQMNEMMSFYRQFNTDELLTCITDPHGETGPGMDAYWGGSQRDEYSRKFLVTYLRDMRKLSLADLGTRWYGDPNKYKSWDDVTWPREREYYGWDNGAGRSQDLSGTWKLGGGSVADGEAAGYATNAFDDSKWFSFQQPGASYIDVTHRPNAAGGWNRFTFTPDDALAKSGQTVYLTICPFNDARKWCPDTIYLNGQKVGELTFGYGLEWAQYDVTSLIKPGAPNVLAVHSIFGMMRGPTFLTLKKAEHFPTSDPTLNARWYDTREWIAEDVAHGNTRDIVYARGVCPDIPFKIMAYDSMVDVMNPYVEKLGVSPHCTGEGAFFRPWNKRYGYLRGIADSSEPSAPGKNVEELKGIFFCMQMEGMNAHDYFQHLSDILHDPLQKAWYDRNEPYFDLMGAFDLKKPDIVIARSLRALRVFPTNVPEENDIGRGDIEAAKYSYVYASEREIADKLVGNYKVMIDDNLHALQPEDVDHLQQWVQDGGTLVLNQRSGREDYLKGTTWPVAKLLGAQPVIRPQSGNITFDANPAILKIYAGKTFANEGHSIDWQKYDYFYDSITVDDPGADAQIVARYDDGKPAIWIKPLGKGRIVMLGSAFYRNTIDDHGYYAPSHDQTAFYEALFGDLGAAPIVTSTEDKLWSERFVANNGSTEMLVLGSRVPLTAVAATWELGFHPTRVFDPVDGSDIKVKISGTKVEFQDLDFAANQLRYYAVSRSDWKAGDTVTHWLGRQAQLWHHLDLPAAEPPVQPLHAINIMGDYEVKQFTDEAEARKALAPGAAINSSWQSMRSSNWMSAGLSTGKDVVTVYRKTIQVTPIWLKGVRGVETMRTTGPAEVGSLEMAINGKVIFQMPHTGPVDEAAVLAALRPGSNLITFLCKGGGNGIGGFDCLYALRRLPAGQEVDLSTGWTGWTSDTSSEPVRFPAKGKWTLVRRDLTLTDEMKKAGAVWCEVDGGIAAVSVNGHVLYSASHYGAQYPPGKVYRVNITAALKQDGPNEIAIGPSSWISGRFEPGEVTAQSVKLIVVPKG